LANGGAFNPAGFGTYLYGSLVVGFFVSRRGIKLTESLASSDDAAEAFK
jgi:hypothetical protein